MEQILRKEIERTVDGNIETVKYEIIKNKILDKEHIEFIEDQYCDCKISSDVGVYNQIDYSFISIDLILLFSECETKIDFSDDDTDCESLIYEKKMWEEIISRIKEYTSYVLHFEVKK